MDRLDHLDLALVTALRHLDPPELAELVVELLRLAGGEDERASFLQRVQHLRQYVASVPLPTP